MAQTVESYKTTEPIFRNPIATGTLVQPDEMAFPPETPSVNRDIAPADFRLQSTERVDNISNSIRNFPIQRPDGRLGTSYPGEMQPGSPSRTGGPVSMQETISI
jgi:hypothetical protein